MKQPGKKSSSIISTAMIIFCPVVPPGGRNTMEGRWARPLKINE